MEKGKTIAIIAEELEEKEDEIKKIYDIALKYAPNYDSEQIYAELNKDKVSSNCVFEPDSDYPAPINSPSKNQ